MPFSPFAGRACVAGNVSAAIGVGPPDSNSVAYALGASLASEDGVVVGSCLVRRMQAQTAPNGIHDSSPR